MEIRERIQSVRSGSRLLASASHSERIRLLNLIIEGLERDRDLIAEANRIDLEECRDGESALLHRLAFTPDKFDSLKKGVERLSGLKDSVGKVLEKRELDDNLILTKVAVPLGVIGMVFEARPDALVQITSLAVKSGNGIVLKGGSEALRTNRALVESIKRSSRNSSIKDGWICLLETRDDVKTMLSCKGYIDLIIPRGSNRFVSYVTENTEIPVLGHSSGICHLYAHSFASPLQAAEVIDDSKSQYPAACNALETLLVDRAFCATLLPALAGRLAGRVKVHADRTAIQYFEDAVLLEPSDFENEYLDLEMNVAVVDSADEAIEHINRYGSHHTDAVLTVSSDIEDRFIAGVDSADVFVNCSTRFADGFRFGLGAEVGISTSKIHARGPVGVEGLMTSKWILKGAGQMVKTYSGESARPYTHKELL